jgi:predicted permease
MFRRLAYWWRLRRSASELVEEMESHRALHQQRLEGEGLSAQEAAAASHRLMGNVTLAREDARGMWIWPWVESVWQDITYALRHLRRNPSFALTAAGTLVIASVLNTGLFSLFRAVALKPWPVEDPDTVVQILTRGEDARSVDGFSLAELAFLREHARSFSGLVAHGGGGGSRVGATPGPYLEYVQSVFVTAGFFDTLGIPMSLGRSFHSDEDRLESPVPVAILGAGLWHRAFGADPSILGRTVYINSKPVTIVGVAADGLTGNFPFRSELWMPLASLSIHRSSPSRHLLSVSGRLLPNATRASALAEVRVLVQQLDAEQRRYPRTAFVTGTRPYEYPGAIQKLRATGLVFCAVTVLLLLGCANVGNLQLARAIARRRELSVRLSLGASRGRIVRQLLTETLVLSVFAGVVGLAVAYAGPGILARLTGDRDALNVVADRHVFAYALVLCAAITIFAGLAPAMHGTKDAAAFVQVQRGTLGARRPLLRGVLLSVQVALGAALLFASILLTRGVQHAAAIDPGFDLDRVTVAKVTLPQGAYDATRAREFVRELVAALQASPVGPVGVADVLPLQRFPLVTTVRRPADAFGDARTVHLRPLSASAFGVLGIPLVAGRTFSEHPASKEVVVNEAFARALWPDRAAIGQYLIDRNVTYEVVGVARDVQFTELGLIEPGLHQPPRLGGVPALLIRTQGGDIRSQVLAVARGLEPRATVTVAPLNATIHESLEGSYAGIAIGWTLGGLALVVAIMGVFGVFSYIVQERAREIGIRMALGARRSEIVRLLFDAARQAILAGLGAALIISIATGQVLRSFLFGLSPFDPLAYLGAAVVLVLAASVATIIPLRRALRVDPVVVLRAD